jgi:hypothetical protein
MKKEKKEETKQELILQAYHLKKWDKAKHWKVGEILTFNKMDWMYAQWLTEKWEIKVGHSGWYILNKETNIYEWITRRL